MKSAVWSTCVGAVSIAVTLVASAPSWAQIYKIIDPVTGAAEYTNQPKKGAVRITRDETLSEIPTGARQKSELRAGSTQASFRERSLKLKLGMDAVAVEKLLGKPAKTNAKTYGSATKEPWNGISWEFATAEGRLLLVFQTDGDSLYLNNWSWR